ncbi:Vitamin B12 import ATP-binding protein BtuD [Streptomyces rimosus subsp. rimosus]
MIRFESVTKRYPDGTTAVDDLSFEVAEGELVTLVGPSGCGKTTTMKMVNRLIDPTSGRIFVEGRDIATTDPVRLRRRIGYVIQQTGLFPHRTVLDNTATVPHLLGRPRSSPGTAPPNSWNGSVWTPPSTGRAIRSSCPAASGSASAWPAHWPPIRPSC